MGAERHAGDHESAVRIGPHITGVACDGDLRGRDRLAGRPIEDATLDSAGRLGGGGTGDKDEEQQGESTREETHELSMPCSLGSRRRSASSASASSASRDQGRNCGCEHLLHVAA